MARILMILCFVALAFKDGFAVKCVQCASRDLLSNWQMTGYPIKFQNQLLYTDTCNVANLMKNWLDVTKNKELPGDALVDCASVCVSYSFQHPDFLDQSLIVRGCLDKLMGRTVAAKETCEYGDQVLKINSEGKEVATKSAFISCNGDKCNNIWDALLKGGLVDPTTQMQTCQQTSTTGDGSCIKCSTKDNNCKSGSCTNGKYCLKDYAQIDDNSIRQVTKSCSPVNPFGASMCVKVSTTTSIQTTASIDYKADVCYCQGSNCNGSTRFVANVIVLFCGFWQILTDLLSLCFY